MKGCAINYRHLKEEAPGTQYYTAETVYEFFERYTWNFRMGKKNININEEYFSTLHFVVDIAQLAINTAETIIKTLVKQSKLLNFK